MLAGAMWLLWMIWKTSALGGGRYIPHLLGAVITGFVLARAVEGPRATSIAATSATLWFALRLIARVIHENALALGDADSTPAPWNVYSSWSTFLLVGAVTIVLAIVTSRAPLRGRTDHRLLWLLISALVTLGGIVVSLLMLADDRNLEIAAVICMLVAPVAAGALTQALCPSRMIWTCGGGCVVFILMMLDEGISHRHVGDMLGASFGVGIFILLGAGGARLGWWLFRRRDPHVAVASNLPTATTQ